jgi:drug/metabolite transporter (DMT)-like permease
MAGTRFLVAGAILYLAMRISGHPRPTLSMWKGATAVGVLLLLGGNGGVVWSEQFIPSGVAALFVGACPFWMVLLGWLWLKEPRPTVASFIGLVIGFMGVVLLIKHDPASNHQDNMNYLKGALAVLFATISWSVGSIYSKRATLPPSPIMASAAEMLSGGGVMFLFGCLLGEFNNFQFSRVEPASWYGLAYLIVGGSLIGFTAYVYILRHARPAMVSTYAYVNPVIAVFLGWLLGGEEITARTILAAALIVGAVVLISTRRSVKADTEV